MNPIIPVMYVTAVVALWVILLPVYGLREVRAGLREAREDE